MKCRVTVSLLAILFMMAASASAGPLIKNGLSFYYSFDAVAGNGTTVADGSGNGYHGAVVGDVVHTSGVVGGAAQFWTDGVDLWVENETPESVPGEYWNRVELPATAIKNGGDIPTSGFTLALWVNTIHHASDNPDEKSVQSVFCPYASDETWVAHALLCGNTDTSSDTDYYRFTARGLNSTKIDDLYVGRYDSTEGPVWEEWTHIAMTYDKTDGVMKFYEDGALVGEDNNLQNAVDMCNNWDRTAWIGAESDPARQFLGSMDEYYVFTRALEQSEIQTLVNGPPAGDANCDGKVDGSDVTILANNWQTGVGDGVLATWDMGDFNGDNKVDGSDVTILANNWQHNVSAATAAVPEPSTVVLLLGAIAGLTLMRRRK